MVDFILLAFFVATFAAGFWLGKTFLTWSAAVSRGKAWAKGLFD